jgi:hypothetical protein
VASSSADLQPARRRNDRRGRQCQAGGTCGNDCRFAIGLYLDGNPVPASGLTYAWYSIDNGTCASSHDSMWRNATIDNVPAGIHTIAVGITQTQGAPLVDTAFCLPTDSVVGPYAPAR